MPFKTFSEFAGDTGVDRKFIQKHEPSKETSFFDAFNGALKIDNTIGSFLNQEEGLPSRGVRPSSRAGDFMQRAFDEGFEIGDIDSFQFVENDSQYDALVRQINKEKDIRETITNSGIIKGSGAILAASILDPVNFITIGAAGIKAAASGISAIRAFKTTSMVALPSITASEAILSSTQVTRSPEEVMTNIAAGTLFSGILGASVNSITKQIIKTKGKKIEEDIQSYMDDPDALPIDDSIQSQFVEGENLSVGAARTPEVTLEQETILNPSNKLASGVFKFVKGTFGQLSPTNRLFESVNIKVRKITEGLLDMNLALNKNAEGISTADSVSTNVRRKIDSRSIISNENHRGIYKEYRKKVMGSEDILNSRQFNIEVSKSLRRGDTHDNEFVQRAAQSWRKNFYDLFREEAIAAKILPEDIDIETAISYLNRVYNQKKIVKNTPEFKNKLSRYIREESFREMSVIKSKLNDFDIELSTKKRQELKDQLIEKAEDLDDYIEETVNGITETILGFDQVTQIFNKQASTRGPLKDRTINIPDEIMEDFLENDIVDLSHRFARTISPEIELTRKFGTAKFDSTDKANPLVREILDERNRLEKLAKSKEEVEKINIETKRDLEDLAAMWDLVRGTYRARKAKPDDVWRRGLHAARTFNTLRLLGKVVISSLGDPFILANANGYSRFFKSSIGLALNKTLKGMNKEQTRRIGKAGNTVLNTKMKANYEIGDPYAMGSGFERGLENISRSFGNVSTISYWNDFWEQVSTLTNQMHIMDSVIEFNKTGKLAKQDEIYLSKLGIDQNLRGRILKQYEKHGIEHVDGTRILNTQNWDNKVAAQAVDNALNKAVSAEVIIKTVGDKPVFSEGSIGQTFTQFMSFGLAANNKLVLSGLQNTDAKFLATQINFLLTGALIVGIKAKLSGKELPEDNAELIIRTLEQNPQLMLPSFVDNMADSLGIGSSNFTDNPRKPSVNGVFKALSGPSGGLITDGFYTTQGISKLLSGDKPTSNEVNSARKMVPFNNIFYISPLVDAAVKELKTMSGIKDKKRKNKRRGKL